MVCSILFVDSLLRVVPRVTLVPHVVVFATILRRFVEDPPTIVDFVVPKQGTSLSSIPALKKRFDILER